MEFGISHDWSEESLEAKARWFRSLSLEERMQFLCEMTDLILRNNPRVADLDRAEPTPGRIQVLELE